MTRRTPPPLRILALAALVAWGCTGPADSAPGSGGADVGTAASATPPDSLFAPLVAELSEAPGFFDTDNLISNESSYLHAVSALNRRAVQGGAYVGVGPDQNFSYIAAVRPEVAFIVDIRRDNLLLLLLFRAFFEEAPTRAEYLSLLFGRPLPDDRESWRDRPLEELLDRIEDTPPDPGRSTVRDRLFQRVERYGIPIAPSDRATLTRFHEEFVERGPRLRYTSLGRPPAPWYPTYRELLLETDLEGNPSSYLVDEAPYQFLRDLQARNGVIPAVGDLAGPHTIPAIGDYLEARGIPISAYYVSNVEFYLWRGGSFAQFVENVASLPLDDKSVLIRSAFVRTLGIRHPRGLPGYASVQLVQPAAEFVRSARGGAYRSYLDVVAAGEG